MCFNDLLQSWVAALARPVLNEDSDIRSSAKVVEAAQIHCSAMDGIQERRKRCLWDALLLYRRCS